MTPAPETIITTFTAYGKQFVMVQKRKINFLGDGTFKDSWPIVKLGPAD